MQTAKAQLQSAQSQLSALKAQIEQTQSTFKVEAANLNYARIYAPMDGTVVSITSRQGQTLNTNQMAPTIMTVANLSTMTVKTQVSEADISKLKLGMSVYFTTLGSQGRRWYGKLDRIQPTPEVVNNVVLYNALFEVPNEQRLLMTQMSTQVFFIENQAKNTILVPMAAVHFGAGIGKPAAGAQLGGAGEKNVATENPAARPQIDTAENQRPSVDSQAQGEKRQAQGEQRQGGKWTEGRERRASGAMQGIPRTATVTIMLPNGRIEERSVKVGVSNRVQAQIIEGLKEGEQVVVAEIKAGKQAKPAASAMGGGPRMMR